MTPMALVGGEDTADRDAGGSRPGSSSVVAVGCITVGLSDHRHPLPGPVAAPHTLTTATVPPVAVGSRGGPLDTGLAAGSRHRPVGAVVHARAQSRRDGTGAHQRHRTGMVPTGTVPGPDRVGRHPRTRRLVPGPRRVLPAAHALLAGDQVQVSLADGAVVNFVVTSVAMYTKTQFPAQQVYASHGDQRAATRHLRRGRSTPRRATTCPTSSSTRRSSRPPRRRHRRRHGSGDRRAPPSRI